VVSAVQDFYGWMVEDAIARGEIPDDTDPAAVVNMLLAMFLGMGFYAGFIVDSDDMAVIAKQLHHMMTRGLLGCRQTGPPLTITLRAPAPAAAAIGDFVPVRPGLTG
jgi:hypothetical protein